MSMNSTTVGIMNWNLPPTNTAGTITIDTTQLAGGFGGTAYVPQAYVPPYQQLNMDGFAQNLLNINAELHALIGTLNTRIAELEKELAELKAKPQAPKVTTEQPKIPNDLRSLYKPHEF
jgi:hypothetical protein